jgi:plastocyanin
MSTVRKVIITTVVVVVGLGGWWVIASMSANDMNDSSNDTTNGQEQGESADENVEAAATITYTGEAFTPATITVKAGDTIKIMNDGENVMYFASDEHPTHLDNSELNVGDVEPGSSATFTIASSGTWGFHDHYNASAGGEIIAE